MWCFLRLTIQNVKQDYAKECIVAQQLLFGQFFGGVGGKWISEQIDCFEILITFLQFNYV